MRTLSYRITPVFFALALSLTLKWLVNILKLLGRTRPWAWAVIHPNLPKPEALSGVAIALREQRCVQCTSPWSGLGLLYFPAAAFSVWLRPLSPCDPSCVPTNTPALLCVVWAASCRRLLRVCLWSCPGYCLGVLPMGVCSALPGGRVINGDGLWGHRCWEREHQPCGCEPRGESAPSSSLYPMQNAGEEKSTRQILLRERASSLCPNHPVSLALCCFFPGASLGIGSGQVVENKAEGAQKLWAVTRGQKGRSPVRESQLWITSPFPMLRGGCCAKGGVFDVPVTHLLSNWFSLFSKSKGGVKRGPVQHCQWWWQLFL